MVFFINKNNNKMEYVNKIYQAYKSRILVIYQNYEFIWHEIQITNTLSC